MREDHLRIQVLLPNLNFEAGWKLSSEIDDFLESHLSYAFDEDFGYLTACPTNVGTGLRGFCYESNIPALAMTGHIDDFIKGLTKIGLTAREAFMERELRP